MAKNCVSKRDENVLPSSVLVSVFLLLLMLAGCGGGGGGGDNPPPGSGPNAPNGGTAAWDEASWDVSVWDE